MAVHNFQEVYDYPEIAKQHVYLHANTELGMEVHMREIYVVWFSYILGGWKALLSTSIEDGRYYEVTFNKEKKETYVDTYQKISNKAYPQTDGVERGQG